VTSSSVATRFLSAWKHSLASSLNAFVHGFLLCYFFPSGYYKALAQLICIIRSGEETKGGHFRNLPLVHLAQ
jgi:hypothetical protein